MRPFSSALALVVFSFAANSAFGQYILTMDFVQRRYSMHDVAGQREKVASISVSVIPGEPFVAKASIGGETVEFTGTIKPTKDGDFEVIANPKWSKTTAEGVTAKGVHIGVTFNRKLTLAAKSDQVTQDECAIDRQRIRLEDSDSSTGVEELRYRWLGDTLVVGGIVQNRITRSTNKKIREYFYLQLKEARGELK